MRGIWVRSGQFLVAAIAAAVITLTVSPGRGLAQTPTPTPGSCCSEHAGSGCDDVGCQACVCDGDPLCCVANHRWDDICVADATDPTCASACHCDVTPPPTPTPGGSCCSPHSGPGCDVPACQGCVCGRDSECCTNLWDATCTGEAQVECGPSCPCAPLPTDTPAPTPTPGGDCCLDHDGTGCDDSTCQACVCGRDSECCDTVWDGTCANEASEECALQCPCGNVGDCCAAHDGVGCSDAICKNCICDLDPDCCTEGLGWDQRCVDEANAECVVACTCEVAGTCCEAHFDTLGCDDRRCQDCVCSFDQTCCADGWDGTCADIAGTDCHERCSGCGPSNCCGERDGPGCEDAACQACVCNVDNFCCDTGWDGSCVDIANANCPSTCLCSPSTCVGDCNGDGTVNISELIIAVNIALSSRPVGDCSVVDQNNDGQVTVNELILAVNAALGGC